MSTASLDALCEKPGTGEGVTAPPARGDDHPVTVIGPRRAWRFVNVAELWQYRELLYFLVWRDVKVRYKQTALGAAWAVIQPLATMLVFTLFLGRLGAVPADDLPYPLFVFAGLLPWTFFANAVTASGQSMVANQELITKVYFPRLTVPAGAACVALVDFGIAFALLLGMLLAYGVLPGDFIWSAGLGDIAIGLTALWVALALVRRPGFAGRNLLGMLDLVAAVTLGARNRMLATGVAGEITTGPMAERMRPWPIRRLGL